MSDEDFKKGAAVESGTAKSDADLLKDGDGASESNEVLRKDAAAESDVDLLEELDVGASESFAVSRKDAASESDASVPIVSGENKISRKISRRGLVSGAIGAGVLLAAGGTIKAVAGDMLPVRPPGSLSEEHFIAACIRCNRCRGACPRAAIVNCDFEDGIINIRTPRLNFHTKARDAYKRASGMKQEEVLDNPYSALLAADGVGFCDFCMLCAQSCPTGALSSFDPDKDWIGEAVIDPTFCIAFGKAAACRKCADYCPFAAISIDDNGYPVIDSSKCNGCGVCENICPTSTYRTFRGQVRRGVNIEVLGRSRPQ
ncbi:MAG: 4Fe-4S dicluster domain-containing protein [Coriobacteriales bacterium]|jgi:ferredoxin-type protein NapG|nr:4Fe-4S dicluster domain-containing protein [Coriobacteriales bacterium]